MLTRLIATFLAVFTAASLSAGYVDEANAVKETDHTSTGSVSPSTKATQSTPAAAEEIEVKMEVANDPKARVKDIGTAQVFESAKGGYQIAFPEGWEIRDGFMGMDVIALSPIENPSDDFRDNANVIFSEVYEQLKPDEYYRQNIELLKRLLTDYQLDSEGNETIDGVDSKWIKYSHRMGEVKAMVLQYLLLANDKAYVVTFTAKPSEFSLYEPLFRKVIQSMKFSSSK